jgi:excisionase family DNA binding protein
MDQHMDRPRCLTVAQVAAELQVHVSIVYRMIAAGDLPYIPVGKTGKRVSAKALDEYIESASTTRRVA